MSPFTFCESTKVNKFKLTSLTKCVRMNMVINQNQKHNVHAYTFITELSDYLLSP